MTVLQLLIKVNDLREKVDKLEKIERMKRDQATGLVAYRINNTKVKSSNTSDTLDKLVSISDTEEEKNKAIEEYQTLLTSANALLSDRAEDKGQAVLFDLYVLGFSMAEVRAIYSLKASETKPLITKTIKVLEEINEQKILPVKYKDKIGGVI